MRYTGILSLTLSAALLLLGCGTDNSSTRPPDPSDAKIANAKEKISDAEKATAEAARAKRDECAREMHKRLDKLDAKCKELETRAAKAEGEAKKDLEKKLKEAKVKRAAAARKLGELKEAGADRWEKAKAGVGNALEDLEKVFE